MMVKQKRISQDCLFNWGGGEPTICKEFEAIAEFLHKNKNIVIDCESNDAKKKELFMVPLKSFSISSCVSKGSK